MRALVISVVALASIASSAAAATTKPYSPARTTTCLAAHQILANAVARKGTIPSGIPAVSVIQFSFALVPAQALDHGWIVFERDAATAKRASAALYADSVAAAQRVQGISLTQAKAQIRTSMALVGNAIVVWENQHVKAASKQRIASCFR